MMTVSLSSNDAHIPVRTTFSSHSCLPAGSTDILSVSEVLCQKNILFFLFDTINPLKGGPDRDA